jgi:hypothetical protein
MQKKLTQWHHAKTALDNAKKAEAALRKEIVAELFANAPPGTHYRDDLLPGFRVRGVVKMNRTVKGSVAQIKEVCARTGIAYDLLFSDSEKVNVKTAWEKLPARQQAAFVDLIVETPGMPTLDVVEAKEG